MGRTGRRRVSKGNVIAGVVALLTLAALISAPLWMIKAGQAVKSQRDQAAYRQANHRGEVVRDGSMSFTVDTMRCGVTEIGEEKPDHGQFCVFDIAVANEGTQPVSFNAISQRAYGSKGGFYVPDPVADAVSNKASDTVPDVAGDPALQDESELDPPVAPPIKPGTSRNVQIVYDLPLDVKLTQIDLHATEYSEGVVVLL